MSYDARNNKMMGENKMDKSKGGEFFPKEAKYKDLGGAKAPRRFDYPDRNEQLVRQQDASVDDMNRDEHSKFRRN